MSEVSEHAIKTLVGTFAQHLLTVRFTEARTLLAPGETLVWSEDELREAWDNLFGDQQPSEFFVEVANIRDMAELTSVEPGDVGWAYVPIATDVGSEAIAAVVVDEGYGLRLRALEFGRD